MNLCPSCGKEMTIHFSGDIPGRLAPLNWYECENCGRPEKYYETVITTTDDFRLDKL